MSLRTRILLLVLLATLIPAALFGLYMFNLREREIAEAKQNLNARAASAAVDLVDKVSGTVQLLHGLSRAPDLDSLDRESCSVFLANVLKRYPQYTSLLTIRPDGQLHCDSLASGHTLDLNDRAYFKKALTSAEPVFEAVFGRLTGVAVLQIAYPARDSLGGLKYVLLASLNLAQFGAHVRAASPQTGTAVVIWDDKGTVMFRNPDDGPKKLAGSVQAESALYRFARSGQAGDTAELAGLSGLTKIWARSALPSPAGGGLSLTLGMPRDELLAEVDRDLRHGLAVFIGASLLALLAAMLFAELRIRRPVARIMRAADRQGNGDPGARIGAPYPRGELGDLMATLDATAGSVQAQQSEIERKSGELQRTNRTLRVLSAINSTIARVRDREELLAEACRIAAREGKFPIVWAGLVDRESRQVRPVAWQGVDEAYIEDIRLAETSETALVAEVIRDKRALIVNDVAAEARLTTREAAAVLGSRSLVILPLISAGEVAGVFVLHSSETGFFDAQEMKLLDELAGDIAYALEFIGNSEKLDHLAYYDSLTGLANRTLFHDRLSQFLPTAGREGRQLAMVVVDVARFRVINDSFGRLAGDEVLKQIARRANAFITDTRWFARTGADQFASIIPDIADRDGVVLRLEHAYREIFGKPFRLDGAEVRVDARIGIALFPQDGADTDTLFRNAEAALKKAKAGNDRWLFYDPRMAERVAEKLTLENKLRLALDNGEFVLHYQPRVDLASRKVVGAEALVRWQTPERGLVPPSEFIPMLEETGLIRQLGAWTLGCAARDYRRWQEAGLKPPRIAVNVSPFHLRRQDFVRELAAAIGGGTASTGIDLDIIESMLMEDIEGNILKLKEVRALGLNIAIDRFGTGHSSLAQLANLPVQTLKIDRTFIATMLENPDATTMVSTIITLAHSLRMTVVAVGVETEEQAKILRLLRCDQMQGFLLGMAVPADIFEARYLALHAAPSPSEVT